MRLISNSEVGTWLHCKRQYYYGFVADLEPKVESDPLTKGTLIHAILEQYYVGKASGYDESECVEMAMQPLIDAAQKPYSDISDLGDVRELMLAYFAHYLENDARYKVYAVETELKANITENYALAGTIDLIVQDEEDGRFLLWDHKSSYNFWTDAQAEITGQFPKYVFLGRQAGLDVKGFIINQIRTRKLKPGNELFRRTRVNPTENKIRSVMRQHMQASEEIIAYRQTNDLDLATPRFDKYACAHCSFIDLCDAQSNGAPTKYIVASEFKKRDGYGYNHREKKEDES